MGKRKSQRPEPERDRARAIAEQRRSSASGIHKNKRDLRHQHVVVDGEDMCLCGEEWPCA